MRQLPLIAFLVTFLSVLWRCAADLQNRAEVCTYSCPLANADHYPVGLGSGPSNNTLRCNYPPVWNCQYDTSTGLLLRDQDEGYCLTSASCRTSPCSSSDCPPSDKDDLPLGLGSQAYGSVLFCVYPGARQLSMVTSYCNYNMSTGDLTADHATSTCAPRAISQGCATAATSTAFMTSTVTSTPSAALSKARKSMIAVGTSLGVVAIVMVFITMCFIIKRRSELKGGGGGGSNGNSSNGGIMIATPPGSAALLRNNGGFQDSATYPTTRDRSVYSSFSASSGLNPMQPNLPQV